MRANQSVITTSQGEASFFNHKSSENSKLFIYRASALVVDWPVQVTRQTERLPSSVT